jgi:hypothetical protein
VFLTGVVRWTEDPATGDWLARVLVAPAGVATGLPAGAPTPGPDIFLSDVAPVPGTGDFYLITPGDPASAATETCLYYSEPGDEFFATGLRAKFPPLDPGYAGVVDPALATDVYVGTVTGVWRGRRGAGPPASGAVWPHDWASRVNGLPQSLVQDLHVWHDPAGGPRLLRAATQSRGVWELDLAAPATGEPQRTYLRVHAADDRRRLPTPLKDPRKAPGPPATPTTFGYASPDIVLRPRANAGIRPSWPLKPSEFIGAGVPIPEYELWTFQTAFRWHHPSVVADGIWDDSLGELVALYRSTKAALLPAEPKVVKAVWDDVVRDTRLTAAGEVSTDPAHPFAVYRPPWQTPVALDAVPTELDLAETVRYPRELPDQIPHVYREDCTVDVLIHHRDTNPVARGGAFAFLFWRKADTHAENLAADTTSLRAYATAVVAGAPPPSLTDGWTAVQTAGSAQHFLPVELDARMPRAVSIDFDSRVAPSGRSLILVAVAGSSADPLREAPVGVGARPGAIELARGWPYAAVRLFQTRNRR